MTPADQASRERGQWKRGASPRQTVARLCYFDGADISHRRIDAWHCGNDVHPLAYHERERIEAAKDRLLARPRCMICDAPLNPKVRGATCSRRCAYTRFNWFRRAA